MNLYDILEYQLQVCNEKSILDVFEGGHFKFIIHPDMLDDYSKKLFLEEAHKRGFKITWKPGETLIGLEPKKYAPGTTYKKEYRVRRPA